MSSPQYLQVRPHDQQISKTTTAAVTLLGGLFLIVLSGLTFAATVIGLVVATPLLVIFSPVIIPAAVTFFLIVSGLVVSAVCGAAAAFVFYWVYCYGGGKRQIEYAKEKLGNAAHEMKERIAAARLGSQAAQDLRTQVMGGRENNLSRDITVN